MTPGHPHQQYNQCGGGIICNRKKPLPTPTAAYIQFTDLILSQQVQINDNSQPNYTSFQASDIDSGPQNDAMDVLQQNFAHSPQKGYRKVCITRGIDSNKSQPLKTASPLPQKCQTDLTLAPEMNSG